MINKKHYPSIFFIIMLGTLDVICFNGIVRGLLIPYLVELNIKDSTVYTIYCNTVTLVYMFPLLGAIISDYFLLGMNKTLLLGSTFILASMFLTVINNEMYVYYSLVFLIIGSGLIKAITPPLLGKICRVKKINNDFSYFCQNISFNFGSICGLFLIGSIGEYFGWKFGFFLGFLISICLFCFSLFNFIFYKEETKKSKYFFTIFTVLFFFIISYLYLNISYLADIFTISIIFFIILKMVFLVKSEKSISKKEAVYILYMMFMSFIFVCLFEQSGSNLLLFCDRLTDKTILDTCLPISFFRAFDPLFTVLIGFIYIIYFKYFMVKKHDTTNSLILNQYKFLVAFLLLTICFFIIYCVCSINNVEISAWIIVSSYFLFALSEINIIPMGYAMIGYFDAKYNSTILTALWSSALSLGSWGSGKIAILLTNRYLSKVENYNINSYSKIFESLFLISNIFLLILILILFFFKSKKINV